MRLDKYLKVSRLIKRRTVANEACDAGRVFINDKVAKAGAEVKVGDVIENPFWRGQRAGSGGLVRRSMCAKKKRGPCIPSSKTYSGKALHTMSYQ